MVGGLGEIEGEAGVGVLLGIHMGVRHSRDHPKRGWDSWCEIDGQPEKVTGIECCSVFFVYDQADTSPTDVGELGFEVWSDFGEHLWVDLV